VAVSLAQPLHADITIGIDVKNNACCLLCVGSHGARVSSSVQPPNRGKAKRGTALHLLCEIIGREARYASDPITPRRAASRLAALGRAKSWGARRAIDTLRADGFSQTIVALTVLENP